MSTAGQPTVVVGVHDEPPVVAPGVTVEIVILERSWPAAVYADLLVHPYDGEAEQVLAASYLFSACHKLYQEGRRLGFGQNEADHWVLISRLLGLVEKNIHTLCNGKSTEQQPPGQSCLGERPVVLHRLLSGLQVTILNLLRKGVSGQAAVWASIDSSFADVDRRIDELLAASNRQAKERRDWTSRLRHLSVLQYLSDPVSTTTFVNQGEYLQALEMVERIGLDYAHVTLGVYQGLPAVALVRGVKQ